MMVSVHAAIGAALGRAVSDSPSALVGGVASHMLCDLVPHRDYDIKVEAPLAVLMFGWLIWRYGVKSPQFWGAVGAVIPDGENALSVLGLLPGEKRIFPTHNEDVPWFRGHGQRIESPLSQIFLAALALWLADRA